MAQIRKGKVGLVGGDGPVCLEIFGRDRLMLITIRDLNIKYPVPIFVDIHNLIPAAA